MLKQSAAASACPHTTGLHPVRVRWFGGHEGQPVLFATKQLNPKKQIQIEETGLQFGD